FKKKNCAKMLLQITPWRNFLFDGWLPRALDKEPETFIYAYQQHWTKSKKTEQRQNTHCSVL
ncbi:MAG: hypothetical protein RSF00_09405, partial [Oscillospiraceae bacterium]